MLGEIYPRVKSKLQMNDGWKGKMKSFNGPYSNEELKCHVDNDLLLKVTYDFVQMSTEED